LIQASPVEQSSHHDGLAGYLGVPAGIINGKDRCTHDQAIRNIMDIARVQNLSARDVARLILGTIDTAEPTTYVDY
jgi:hypothetical protein